MSRAGLSLPRRALLAGVLAGGVAGVAGCDLLDAGGTSDPADVETTAAPVDADQTLVDEVGAAIATAAALAGAVGRGHRSLRLITRPFVALHATHLERLEWTGEDPEPVATKGTAARQRTRLLATEERLQTRLTEAAATAVSGALAQTFASMAAAIAQQRAVA